MSAPVESSASPWAAFATRVLIVVAIVGTVIMLSEAVEAAARVFLVLFGGILCGVFLNGLGRLVQLGFGLSYRWSLTIAVLLLIGLVVGAGWYMVPKINEQIDQFMQQSVKAVSQLEQQIRQYEWGRWLLNQMPTGEGEQGQESQTGGRSVSLAQIGSMARNAVSAVFFYLAAIVIVFFVGLYVASDPHRYREGLVKLIPLHKRDRARTVLLTLGETLWHWLIGRFASMTIVGVATAVGLWLLGVPLPVTLGVIAGLLTFIPNLGPILAFVPQAMLAYQVGTQMVLYVLIFNVVLQTVESYLITPLIQQYEVEMPAAVIISVQVILGALVGWLGLLLATPLAASTMVLLQMLYIEDILGDSSVAPDAEAA